MNYETRVIIIIINYLQYESIESFITDIGIKRDRKADSDREPRIKAKIRIPDLRKLFSFLSIIPLLQSS